MSVPRPCPLEAADDASAARLDLLLPVGIGVLSGLAAVPLQGYVWLCLAMTGATLSAVVATVWASARREHSGGMITLALICWCLTPLIGLPGWVFDPLFLVLLGAPAAVVGTAIASARRKHGRAAGALVARLCWLPVGATAVGVILDLGHAFLVDPSARPDLGAVVGLPVLCLGLASVTCALPVVGAALPDPWAASWPWPARLAARLLAVALPLALFRAALGALHTAEDPREMLVFTTIGQTFFWWAPALGAAFAMEARSLLREPDALRALAATALSVLLLAVAVDLTDTSFHLNRTATYASASSRKLRAVNRSDYPPSWRPDVKGDDFFGDWDQIRERAWNELKRRGEVSGENPWY